MSPGHHLLQGTVRVFLAEALFPLTGIVTAAFLTRNLGAGDYGLLTLSATLISWIELAISGLFARATVKIVGDAKDWRPIGAAVLRLHVLVSIGAMAACLALAKPCAALLVNRNWRHISHFLRWTFLFFRWPNVIIAF